jgi:hypothetical protein
VCFDGDRRSLSGKIPQRSCVATVARCGLHTASRTAGRLAAFRRDGPSLFLSLDAHDVQARRGQP